MSVKIGTPASPPFHGFIPGELQERVNIVPEEEEESDEDFSSIQTRKVTNRELKIELEKRGLATTGIKKVLTQRLADHPTGLSSQIIQENQDNSFHFERAQGTIQRIPYGARFKVADSFIELLKDVIEKNDLPSWTKLLAFARCCLSQPVPSEENKKTSLSSHLKSQLVSFNKGESQQSQQRQESRRTTEKSLKKKIETKIQAYDTKGAVRLASSNESFLAPTIETKEKLEKKHPPPHPETCLPDGPVSLLSFTVSKKDVRKMIKSFRSGSSGGVDGLTPQHLKDISGEGFVLGDKVCETLATFYNNIIFRGLVPSEVLEVYYGANLFGLAKENGDCRPIAIGCTLRRLGGKLAMSRCRPICEKVLRPRQVGVGVKRGCEAAVHALRKLTCDPDCEDWAVLQVDLANAFNSVRRDVVLRKVKEVAPLLYPMTWQAYAQPTKLFMGDHTLQSREGVQQGDVLGPLYFALAIQDMVDSLSSDFRSFFLDDGVLAAKSQTLQEDYLRILDLVASLGLRVNPEKCKITVLKPDNDEVIQALRVVEPKFKEVKLESLELLGAPLLPSAVEPVLLEKLDDLSRFSENLKLLDYHDAFFLLKNCFSIPRVMYYLRCAPCFLRPDILDRYDMTIKKCLQSFINTALHDNDRAWRIAKLPVAFGGLGIRLASDLAVPAFISSCFGSDTVASTLLPESTTKKEYSFLADAVEEWKKILDLGEDGEVPADRSVQEKWDTPICKMEFDALMKSGTCEETAILQATSSEDSSAWVHAMPIRALGLKLDNTSFKIVCGLRIGARICEPYRCRGCGAAVNSYGRHGLSCNKVSGRFPRHTEGNKLIQEVLASIDMPSKLEPRGLCEDNKKPDGHTTFTWKDGKNLAWDWTTSCTVAPSNLSISLKGPGETAASKEKAKCKKYAELMDTFHFVPIASETFGAWGPKTRGFLTELGKQVIAYTCDKRSKFFLFQKLGMCIQRGNASSVLSSFPQHKKLEEIFQL